MHAAGTNGVVDVQLVVDEFNGIDEHNATDKTNDSGTKRRYEVTASRNAYQSCQYAV